MQRSKSVLLYVLLVAVSGCGKESTNRNAPQPAASGGTSLFPRLDPRRLRFPEGWDRFKERVQDAQIPLLNKPITIDEAPEIAQQARQFATADRRGHPANITVIPRALLLCAQVHARAGDDKTALELLEVVRKSGGLFTDLLKDAAFDSIRDTEQFKGLVDFAEAETEEEVYGAYLVRSPPLFALDDLLAAAAKPPLPSAAEVKGKVVVVYTGPKLTPDTIEYLEESAQLGASVHALIAEQSRAPPGIAIHIAQVRPEQLIADETAIAWFANKEGQVVAYLRPFSGPGFAKAIVQRLSKD